MLPPSDGSLPSRAGKGSLAQTGHLRVSTTARSTSGRFPCGGRTRELEGAPSVLQMNHLEMLLKCRFWLWGSGGCLRACMSNQLPP